MLLEPGKLRRGPKAMIEEEERAGRADPGREAKLWPEKLQEAERLPRPCSPGFPHLRRTW